MADYRLNLSDGVTTINLYEGQSEVLQGGLLAPPPVAKPDFIYNPFTDGGRLSSFHYENRNISINLKLIGTDLGDLKATIRSIHRLLNDTSKRVLLGYGNGVYLEYQWGDTVDESTFFDVLRGELVLPRNYLSVALSDGYYILDTSLNLTCKPFGRYTNQDIATDTLENSQSQYEIIESFLTPDTVAFNVDGNNWKGQTFLTPVAFTAVGAAIMCHRAGVITNLTLELYATAGGVPVGVPIATGTVDVSGLDTSGNYVGWVRVIFGTPVALNNATTYALVANIGEANPNIVHWWGDNAAGYANGTRVWSNNAGGAWNIDAADDSLFAIFAAETPTNYQDVTTDEGHGDVPARMYYKVDPVGAAGSEKMWIAKRTGDRQTDDLWIEGEEYTGYNRECAAGDVNYDGDHKLPDTAVPGGLYGRIWFLAGNPAVPTDEAIARMDFTIATVPRGQFRVLMRARVNSIDTPADYNLIKWGHGYSYGNKTKSPSYASGEYYGQTANNVWDVLDLGILNLPPIGESDIAGNSSFDLRLYIYANGALDIADQFQCDIDWIFLLPVDEGVVIIDAVAAADILAMDGITDPPNVFKIDGGDDIVDYPSYVGAPFTLGREKTRVYVLRDDLKSVTFDCDLKYQPQFLVI